MVKRGQKVVASVEDSLPRPGFKRAKTEKTADPIPDKVGIIAEALADPEVVIPNDSCRKMLQAMLSSVLSVPFSERHGYQAQVAAMLGEILKTSQDNWEQKVGEAQSSLDTADTERSSLASALDVADEQLKSQRSEVNSCKEQSETHAEAEKEAHRIKVEADKEVSNFDASQNLKAQDLDQCNSIYKGTFEMLKLATEPLSAKDQKTSISTLAAFVKKLGADSSLQTVIPHVFKKSTAERGDFDNVAVDQVDELLQNYMSTLKTALDSGDSLKAEKIEAQAQAQQALDSAKATLEASKQALQSACDTLISKQSDLKSAQTALDSKVQELGKFAKEHAQHQKQFDKATERLLTYTFLLERDVVPEPVPEVTAEKVEDVSMTEAPVAVEENSAPLDTTVVQVGITA